MRSCGSASRSCGTTPAARPATRSVASGVRTARRRRVRRSQRGSGPISIWFAFVAFLGLLLFAVQAILNLYATSVVTSAAYDAARLVAQADGDPAAVGQAEAHARSLLGRFGDEVTFDWSGTGGDDVVLRVRARTPSVLLPVMRGPVAFDEIDRTVRVRAERFR